ncbi:YveK family protein [Priestia megaterium]|uniref:Chain length determinant family protein n=1 Tax=Priestia megaterium (strain DSM 319 / IMG 1521) TaxID=592022 RepID=D5DBK2_PRIM3|nr:Wzz/FepE/Etk N-terminal domain-containing protein [Priestia megaterium]ADF37984.1 chain length determinant family protein [Priestia megaterium DSM 319]MED4217262.1 Wzz/FepE/Etk N-terminal domain-containing protein [Priestia megaterium]WEZ37231.1 Wzz/FepE/Etk N-terminal domain-containing protein [Priestia megaterium DSM 319]
MEETISLRVFFQVLRKRLWLIALITVIAATISAVISFFVLTPVYQTNTQILVNQAKSEQQLYNAGAVQTNVQLISTYNDIIKSPAILDKVIDKLKLDSSAKSLSGQIQVTSSENSQVAQITVQDTNAKRATEIANTTASVFQKEVPKIMNIDNVSILSKADLATSKSPIKPQPLLNIAIALVVGLMVGVGLSFLLEYLDNTVKTEQDIENLLELPLMGVITNIKDVPKVTNVQRPDMNARVPQRGETFGS